jgi:hypothetical protein
MMMATLVAGFCPERWRKAVDVMLEKIPVVLIIQILIEKRKNGIVFDKDANGCYDHIISGIALLSIR